MLPNFIIIGAAKSGTSSIFKYLEQHPDICMSKTKETNHFAYMDGIPEYVYYGDSPGSLMTSITNFDVYKAQFNHHPKAKAFGEASPLYLYHTQAPGNINRAIPDVKIIVVLRNPVDRAFSHFLHLRRDGREPVSDFYQALELETERMKKGWFWDYFYKDMGLYTGQLKRYYELFDNKNIRVYLFEEFFRDNQRFMADLFRYLGLDLDSKVQTGTKHNISGLPKNRFLHSMLNQSNVIKSLLKKVIPTSPRQRLKQKLNRINLKKPKMEPETRRMLIKYFKKDILNLQALIQKDLSHWLGDSPG